MNYKIFIPMVCCIILHQMGAYAQLLTLSIKSNSSVNTIAVNTANWSTMQNGYNTTNNTIAFAQATLSSVLSGVLPKIGLKSTLNSFTYTPPSDYSTLTNTVPANVVTAEIYAIPGSDALSDQSDKILANSRPVVVTNTDQTMFSGVANLTLKLSLFSTDRPITIKYTISAIGMKQFLKAAGTYTLNLVYNSYNALGFSNGSAETTLTITVAPFTMINSLSDLPRLKFTEAGDYVNGPKAVPEEQLITLTSTVPYNLKIKAGSSSFKDADGFTQNSMLVSHISAQAGSQGKNVLTLSALPTTETTVLLGSNALQQVESVKYGMGTSFTSAYQKAGTYNSSLIFTASNKSGTAGNMLKDLYIDVEPMARLSINGSVNLSFLTADHYRNGIHADVIDHLLIDKNSPFDIYVKANGTYLEGNSATIDLNNLLRIEPVLTDATLSGSVRQVKLTTNYQPLIIGSDAAIGKKISLRYSIDATGSKRLINKPQGTYSTTLTYSFTAQ
jgi:hypothetical protein